VETKLGAKKIYRESKKDKNLKKNAETAYIELTRLVNDS
jgi:hypothetical protein